MAGTPLTFESYRLPAGVITGRGDNVKIKTVEYFTSDTTADAADPMFAVLDDADKLYLIGEREIVQELHALLGEFLAGHVVPDPVSEDDPRFGGHISIAEAVDLAIESGYYVSRKRAANSINVAAGAGRIRGAVQSTTGRWSFPPRTFRHWLMRSQAETRGRPRKSITSSIPASRGE